MRSQANTNKAENREYGIGMQESENRDLENTMLSIDSRGSKGKLKIKIIGGKGEQA